MPFAPPVTIAVRPASRAIVSAFAADAPDEFLEAGQLLLDQVNSGLVLELQRLLVEFLRSEGYDHLGAAEQDDVDRGEGHAQVILHARAAEDTAGTGLQRRRLVLVRLAPPSRNPADCVLQPTGDLPDVIRRHTNHTAGVAI